MYWVDKDIDEEHESYDYQREARLASFGLINLINGEFYLAVILAREEINPR